METWYARRDSNPEPSVPKTDALSVELRAHVALTSRVYQLAETDDVCSQSGRSRRCPCPGTDAQFARRGAQSVRYAQLTAPVDIPAEVVLLDHTESGH